MEQLSPTLLYVYADWVGLVEPTLIGELRYEHKAMNDACSFRYDESWIEAHGNLFLSADIKGLSGWQYTSGNNRTPGLFSDVIPDRWGRKLLRSRERGQGVTTLDMITSVCDRTRIGGLRFKETPHGDFLNADASIYIPPLSMLKETERMFQDLEERGNIKCNDLAKLVPSCCGLGGARPKANMLDKQGNLYVVKFPSRSDTFDVEMWEHFAHVMASKCGINAATTSLLGSKQRHAMLSRRFDRTSSGGRIHMASAMTLLGLEDGCKASTGNGYLDIVDFIPRHCTEPEANLRELYRRVAYNICIGNSDDHFRNHSFLLTPNGWTLSPAYDMNPTNDKAQSLLIDKETSKASLSALLAASEDYMIDKAEALHIIKNIQDGMKDWRETAKHLQIPSSEQRIFEQRFDCMANAVL